MQMNAALATNAIAEVIADPVGMSVTEAARGMLAITDANMVGAIRVLSVERGHDPRDFTLVPFGGAGPLHGCALAELLGIATVLVPPAPGVLCAEGLLAAEPRAEFSRTLAGADDWSPAEAAFRALEADAEAWFNEEGVQPPDRRMRRVALLRYAGQGGELTVAWQNDPAAVRTAFAEAHERLNGFVLDNRIELVTVRLEAAGTVQPPARHALPPGAGSAPASHQTAWFGTEPVEAAIHARPAMGAGDHLVGPAIITQLDATTLLPPGWQADVLPSGALLLRHQI